MKDKRVGAAPVGASSVRPFSPSVSASTLFFSELEAPSRVEGT